MHSSQDKVVQMQDVLPLDVTPLPMSGNMWWRKDRSLRTTSPSPPRWLNLGDPCGQPTRALIQMPKASGYDRGHNLLGSQLNGIAPTHETCRRLNNDRMIATASQYERYRQPAGSPISSVYHERIRLLQAETSTVQRQWCSMLEPAAPE